MTRERHKQLERYLEMLERHYGSGFRLELLSDHELAVLEELLRYAIDLDDLLPECEKLQLFPMLGAVRERRRQNSRYAWLSLAEQGRARARNAPSA